MEKAPNSKELDFYKNQAKAYAASAKAKEPAAPLSREEFMREFPGQGTLKVQLTYGSGMLPVSKATVHITSSYNGRVYDLYNDVTDISGILENITLPAAEFENTNDYSTSYEKSAVYRVSLFHPDFVPIDDMQIIIYDGIKTILPVNLKNAEQG